MEPEAKIPKMALKTKEDMADMPGPPVSATLSYDCPLDKDLVGFRSTLQVPADRAVKDTYCCAIGWHCGYFGMQVNKCLSERRILFSVWDDGKGTPVVPEAFHPESLVRPFGGEGEGMQCILWHRWETDTPQSFQVTAEPDEETKTTLYTGHFLMNDQWVLIGSFRAPADGKYLTGLYSFLENFSKDGSKERICLYGKQSYRVKDSEEWVEAEKAKCAISQYLPGDFFDFKVKEDMFQLRINGTENFGNPCSGLFATLKR